MMRYAVQGKHAPDAEDRVVAVIETYVATCEEAGLDPLLVVSQLLLETDNLTSASPPLRLDPVGLRLSKNEEAERWFSSWPEAARALTAYALPAGSESTAQRGLLEEAHRWRSVPHRLRGSAPTLDRLAGTWTADEGYPEKIRDIANMILQPQY